MSLERRIRRLEAGGAKWGIEPTEEPQEPRPPEKFWVSQVGNSVSALLGEHEPYCLMDHTGAFYTLEGEFAVNRERMNVRGVFAGIREVPEDRWQRFLVADDEAYELARNLIALAGSVEVTEEDKAQFQSTESKWCVEMGDHEGEREVVRLTRALVEEEKALAILARLHRRFRAFIVEEGGGGYR